ncbi:hypothetical protein KUL118_58750 [Tenacibaculum sp. KUL118]|nr:hypothetical protein KUL118_58750 [Tenacibaculum sp. KUL118]
MSIKHLTALTLCLCMLLQNALALGLASHTMQNARGFVGDDIELICTGKTMRYISVSATALEGEFVFISPELLKASVEHVDCTNGTLAELPHIDNVPVDPTTVLSLVRYRALASRLAAAPYTSFAFAAPLGRAPPIA